MIQLDLFNDGITSVTLEDFNVNKNKFDWFKESTHLGIEYENEIYKYYDIEYDFENPSLYLANPLNATITGKTTFHCMRILFDDGDSTLIVYRSLEFMKKRIHVFDIPISINKNDIHSKMIIDMMLDTGFVTFIFKEKYCTYFKKAYPKEQYNDYYYDINNENEIHFSNNQWKKKHCINTLIKDNKYQIVDIHGKNEWTYEALKCRKEWFIGKNNGKKTDNERKYFENSLRCNDDRIVQLAIIYDNKIILAIKTILMYEDKKYAVDIMFSHVSRSRKKVLLENNEINNGVVSNLDECMRYATGTFLLYHGIKREYRLGFIPGNESLHAHKENIASGKINYFSTVKE